MTSGIHTQSSSNNPKGNPSYSFEGFLDGWFHRQDQLLEEITAAVKSESCDNEIYSEIQAKELIARALSHFEEFYEHKSRAAHLNVFSLFSPPWCSSFECAFLWISGFRPGVLLQLVSDSVRDLSPCQAQAIDSLKRETRADEKHITEDLARIQESAGAPPLMDALRGAAWHRNDQFCSLATYEPIDRLQEALEEVVANADTLRMTTAGGVSKILKPEQGLRFLVAAFRLLQGMRNQGTKRDDHTSRRRS